VATICTATGKIYRETGRRIQNDLALLLEVSNNAINARDNVNVKDKEIPANKN